MLPIRELVERERCPGCASTSAGVVSAQTEFVNSWDVPAGSAIPSRRFSKRRLLECAACSLWYYDIVPSRDALIHLLDDQEVVTRWGNELDRLAFSRAGHYLRNLRAGAILDIGSHSGGFLSTLPPEWQKTALEPLATSAERVAGDVICGFLEEVDLGSARYDVITAFDVFEHFHDPGTAMRRIATALKPGGSLIIETGVTDCRAARLLRAGWYYLQYLEHFQAFNKLSLSQLSRANGLAPIETTRVHQTEVAALGKVRSVAAVAVFTVATLAGRQPSLWRRLNDHFRPLGPSLPPSTIGIEKDHLFFVAKKDAPR